jgi:hypothetical protein
MISAPMVGLTTEVSFGSLWLFFWVMFIVVVQAVVRMISMFMVSVSYQGFSCSCVRPHAMHLVSVVSVELVINVSHKY